MLALYVAMLQFSCRDEVTDRCVQTSLSIDEAFILCPLTYMFFRIVSA